MLGYALAFAAGVVAYPFIVHPVTVTLLTVLMDWLSLRGNTMGVSVRYDMQRGVAIYLPCSADARAVLDRYCKDKYRRYSLFKGYYVPMKDAKKVYEEIMHDPADPQPIVTQMALSS